MGKRLAGVCILVVLFGSVGCRAFKESDPPPAQAPSEPPASAPQPDTSKPLPQSAPPPEPNNPQPIDNNDGFKIDLLREALGRGILPTIDTALITLKEASTAGSKDPNISSESGKLEFKQGGISASGNYNKLGTGTGSQVVAVSSALIDFDLAAHSVTSLCGHALLLTGKVRCTLTGVYSSTSKVLDAAGYCFTHQGGISDNLSIAIGTESHKVRYNLSYKVKGDPLNFENYTWVGMALVDGQSYKMPQPDNVFNICNK